MQNPAAGQGRTGDDFEAIIIVRDSARRGPKIVPVTRPAVRSGQLRGRLWESPRTSTFMPVIIAAHYPDLVLRRLAKEDLEGLAEVLPAALGGDVEPWTDEAAWA